MATDLKNSPTPGGIPAPSPREYFIGSHHKWAATFSGFFAGFVFSAVMLILLWANITPRSLANLVADRFSNLLPGSFTEFFIQSIGPLGKQIEFYSVLLGQVLFGGLLGLLFVLIFPQIKGRNLLARDAFLLATAVWAVFILAVLPIIGQGFLGSELGNDQLIILVSSLVLFEIFGGAFYGFFQYLVPQTGRALDVSAQDTDQDERGIGPGGASRRRFIMAMTGLFALAAGAALIGTAFHNNGNSSQGQLGSKTLGDGTLEGEVTTNTDFYHVSKNAIDPTVEPTGWRLRIDGLVNNTITLSLEDIKQMQSQTQYQNLTCISNAVGGSLIGNAKWKGVPLKALLEKAGVKAGVKRVIVKGADGYTDSFDYDKALEPATLAAYEMNDVALPNDHGGPLRLLVPNIYGMKNAKWLTGLTLTDDSNYRGFWAQQGWDNLAIIHTESAITSPGDNNTVKAGETSTIRGYAFAGSRGIQKVELSTDGGKTWNEAKVKEALSPNSWALWNYDWKPDAAANKSYTLVVRATDKTGAVQTSSQADSFPAGANGWHTIVVKTVAAA